jgi:tRNA threonylcarbamoyladenosine biosynthesis protein TsaE
MKPGEQAGLGRSQVHIGHPDLGKSERPSILAQLVQQGFTVQTHRQPNRRAHLTILESRWLSWPDLEACAHAAAALAGRPGLRNACIELRGPLGSGKTTFARYLLRSLGVQGHVKSPTYALLEPYEVEFGDGRLSISHFDFYRFDDPQEWEDAGFRDVFAGAGLKLVEWPEKAEGLLPRPDLRITLEPRADECRVVRFDALSAVGVELLP